MNSDLIRIKAEIYNKCGLKISGYQSLAESKEYNACEYSLNSLKILARTAKITPKKIGQFVTFWKRNAQGITEPFSEHDSFDFYVVNVKRDHLFGQFVFPKSILIDKGIVATEMKDGKRGFRVYPIWDIAENKQAIKTQNWQLEYFYEIQNTTNLNSVLALYHQ